jgi:hypothetical protein
VPSCPLMDKSCVDSKCQLWLTTQECAIKSIADTLKSMTTKMDKIEQTMR